MVRLDRLLQGYREIRFTEDKRRRVMSALISAGLSGEFGKENSICISALSTKKYRSALALCGVEFGEICGLPGIILNNRKRYGVIAALLLALIYYVFISRYVWDVRISGNEELSSYAVMAQLADAGLDTGSEWSSLSLDKVEGEVLATSENIGWLNINRRGNVAYVTVKEKNVPKQIIDMGGYSNIVAKEDCVIEEIRVKQGIAMVKSGDTVRAGELLISGVIPSELGGGLVRAEGEVLGRVYREISVEVPRSESVNIGGDEHLIEHSVKIFNFSINIFKKYGNSYDGCAIIEDTEECVLFGEFRIPVQVKKIYALPCEQKNVTYTDEQLVSVASARLAKLRILRIADTELIRISTYGGFTDIGYRMTSDVTVLSDVGEEKFFAN